MQKKRNTRSVLNFTDIALCAVCICGMAASLNILWKDLNQTMARKDESPIAIIYFKRNTAQRRFVDRNIWERLQQSSELYDGDRIRTAQLSEVAIVFKDSSRIDIHENTMIQVHAQDDQSMINFESGSLAVRSGGGNSSVKVVTGNREITFASETQASIKKTEAAADSGVVAVLEGSAVIKKAVTTDVPAQQTGLNRLIPGFFKQPEADGQQTATDNEPLMTLGAGNIQTLTSGDTAHGGRTMERETEVFMPASVQTVDYDSSKTPVVTWMWTTKEPVSVEFSLDPRFSVITAVCNMGDSGGRKNITLPFAKEGDKIFWRMKSAVSAGIMTSGILYIEKIPKLSPEVTAAIFGENAAAAIGKSMSAQTPELSSVITPEIIPVAAAAPQPPAATVKKVPPPQTAVKKPELKPRPKPAAKKEPEKKPRPAPAAVPAQKTNPPPAVVKKAPEPVPEKKPEPQPPAAVPSAIRTTPLPDPKPAAPVRIPKMPERVPVLQTPAAGMLFTETELTDSSIVFSWEPVEDATSYELVIYRSGNGKRSARIFQSAPRTNKFTLNESQINVLDNGTFIWTVRALGTEYGKTHKSKEAAAEFSIALQKLEPPEIDTSLLVR